MNEAETRAEHIDPALKAAGWGVVQGSRILREYSRWAASKARHPGDRGLRVGLPDAIADLGAAVEIKEAFVGFQKFL